MSEDVVNHPKHYGSHPSGVECITITEHMNFNVGNAVKYLWRHGEKNGLEDLKKARWYVDREIARLEASDVGLGAMANRVEKLGGQHLEHSCLCECHKGGEPHQRGAVVVCCGSAKYVVDHCPECKSRQRSIRPMLIEGDTQCVNSWHRLDGA